MKKLIWIIALLGTIIFSFFLYGGLIERFLVTIGTSLTNIFLVLIILAVFSVIMTIIIFGIMWRSAPQNRFFTKLQTGDIKFVVAGESCTKILINIPGKIIEDGKIIDGDPESQETLLEKTFGLYWVGIYPFRQIYSFEITKERENPEIGPSTEASEWINRDDKPVTVTELRWKFPRPVLVPDVEFADALRANILVLCKFEVVEPLVPIFIQKSKFFDLLSSYVRNGVIDYCQKIDYKGFIAADKIDGGEMSMEIIGYVDKFIVSEIGVSIKGLSVSQYESSDKETQKLLEALKKAELEGDAEIKKQQKEGAALVARAEREAEADILRSNAKIADIIQTVTQLTDQGVDPNVAAQVAGSVGRAERFTRKDSKLTTLVDGSGGANIAIPTQKEDKK